MSYDYYGGGGYGGGGYGRDRDHYGGGHGRDRDDYGGGYSYRRNHDDYGRDRDRGFRGGYDRQDRYDDRRSGGRGWGGFGGGDNRRSRGGWSGGDRNRGRGWGGGRGGGRGMKRDYSGGGGPPSKYFKEESDNNWEESDRHQLMQSVFMDKKPEDLEESWVFLVCPPGKRRVLVAARDVTESYNNAGIPDMKFKSCLPSGSPIMNDVHKHDDLTILDTVYSAEKKRYYIVDMLHWKHYPYYDTDAEFRFFCLPDKYSQLKQPLEKTDNNEYPLELLSKYPADKSSIEEQLKAATGKVEGLLFIRKLSTYECRDSENCMWLKLDKMEETLGIPIPEGVVFAASNTKDEKRRTEQTERQLLKEHRSLKEDAPLAQEGKGDSELEEKEETEEAPDGHDEESAGYEETAEEGYDNSGYKDEEYHAEADQETNEEGE